MNIFSNNHGFYIIFYNYNILHEFNQYRLHSNYNEFTGFTELNILDVIPADIGEYTCTAVNQLGEVTCAANLDGLK